MSDSIKTNIYIAPDQMTAYLRILEFEEDQELSVPDIMAELTKHNITYGIQTEEIGKYCFQKNFRQELKVAIGLRPIKGDDGQLVFGFETVKDRRPKERPDGTVNFRELNLIENVDKDQLLCTVIPPKQGVSGINVQGKTVEGRAGAIVNISNGENTYLSEDKLQVFAACEGGAVYKNKVIIVEEIFRVKGDVGINTGNIEFSGSVSVDGNVPEGFQIIAKKDIEVKGMVEGASLVAGGNILINGGINGMRKAVVRAEEEITTKFIQNATAICGGSIHADVMVNGYVKAGKDIVLKGEKAALVGGEYVAGNRIIAKTIGTENNLAVSINMLPNWYEIEKMEDEQNEDKTKIKHEREEFRGTKDEIKSEIAKMEEVANRLRMEIETLSKTEKAEDDMGQKAALLRKFMSGKMELAARINELKKKLAQMKEIEKNQDCRVICKGTVYPGVKISIGYALLKVERSIVNQHFYADKGEIVTGEVLPHELD